MLVYTNKELQHAAVSQSTLGGSFGRPRLSNCLAQSASVGGEREARAVSDGSRRKGGRGARGRRRDEERGSSLEFSPPTKIHHRRGCASDVPV